MKIITILFILALLAFAWFKWIRPFFIKTEVDIKTDVNTVKADLDKAAVSATDTIKNEVSTAEATAQQDATTIKSSL